LAKPAFYTNESIHIAVAEGLKRRGLKALTARDAGNLGLSDKELHFPWFNGHTERLGYNITL